MNEMEGTHNTSIPPSTGPYRFSMESWISCAPFERLLNMEIVEASEGQAVLRMPFVFDLAQGGGLMHGGALVALADTAVVMAIKSIVAPYTHFATITMKTKFLAPVKQGTVIARAQVTGREGRILYGKADLCNETQTNEIKEIMTFNSVFKIARDAVIRTVTFK